MATTEREFVTCRFNPLAKGFDKKYESLFAIVSAEYEGDPEKLLKYIIATYDPGSPLTKEYTVLPKRKEVAATIAGYDLHQDRELLETIYDCSNEQFAETTTKYLKEYGDSRLWAMIISATELFWEFNLRILTPIKEDKDKDLVAAVNMKSKMSEELERINDRIDRLTKQFYGDEQLQDAVKKGRITPESIAGL